MYKNYTFGGLTLTKLWPGQVGIYYNLLINIRVINKRTNLGKMYFENTYINTTSNAKAKVT